MQVRWILTSRLRLIVLVSLFNAALFHTVVLAQPPRVRVDGTRFVRGATTFEWRGVTAFRLAEMMAHGQEKEATAYLDWARRQQLTVVRVLVMAKHLFALTPEDGRKALPRLLQLAQQRGLHVEVVALADTADLKIDLEAHVRAVGEIAAKYPNAFVEIANEPWHPTQDTRLHDPAFVQKLAALVPAGVPVALGSAEGNAAYATGAYATWHSPRSDAKDGWGHVVALAEGAKLARDWKKPVVSDEPIGAAKEHIPGRRDNNPARFRAAAALSRLAGIGATFHYEGGLHAKIPTGRELECFNAWKEGLHLMRALPRGGTFVQGQDVGRFARVVNAAPDVFARAFSKDVWVLEIGATSAGRLRWSQGWKPTSVVSRPGLTIYRGVR